MARADLLLALAKAGASSDLAAVESTVRAIAAEERRKQHHVLAQDLEAAVANARPGANGRQNRPWQPSVGVGESARLTYEISPTTRLQDLILSSANQDAIAQIVEEQERKSLLRSYGIEPRNRLLFLGPPGNGKTSAAEGLAEALSVPLLMVRYDSLISSYLGESASRLRDLFEHATSRYCVLFFDEFDTLGKERGDEHDTGETKRIVSSVLQELDRTPSHTIVVAATNHWELLDRAAWRRFQLRLEFGEPSRADRTAFFERVQSRTPIEWALSPRTMADASSGYSFSDMEVLCQAIVRRWVLDQPNADSRQVIREEIRRHEYYRDSGSASANRG